MLRLPMPFKAPLSRTMAQNGHHRDAVSCRSQPKPSGHDGHEDRRMCATAA
jgi:hypothetical protein